MIIIIVLVAIATLVIGLFAGKAYQSSRAKGMKDSAKNFPPNS